MEKDSVGCTVDLWASDDINCLFNPDLLNLVDKKDLSTYKTHGVHQNDLGCPELTLRPLYLGDYAKGYTSLLSQLTRVGGLDETRFKAQFQAIKRSPGMYYIVVIEDAGNGLIVGSASLIIERKFIHAAAVRGRIEDVVIGQDYRGRHLASLVVELLTLLGRALGCYKMSLDCKPHLTGFYGKFGYKQETALYMVQRFYD